MLLGDASQQPQLRALSNTANSCYANSLMQALAAVCRAQLFTLSSGTANRTMDPWDSDAMNPETTTSGLGPFLVLSDSTLQYMLRNRSYGAYPFFEGHVLSCPGAALNISCSTVPSILELLHWQFGMLKGFQAAHQSRPVVDMLAAHLDAR